MPSREVRLFGRGDELAGIAALLADPAVALLTLTGTGGVGKTSLALEAARRAREEFAGAVALVGLASLTDGGQVVGELARILEIRLSSPESALDGLKRALRAWRMLLVLDNFEHVIDAAPSIAELTAACPELKVLVTSRAPLRVARERVYEVPVLKFPEPDHGHPPNGLARYPAVALFVEHARSRDPAFRLTDRNAPAVARLCASVGGLPLALELAAAQAALLAPEAILDRLQALGEPTGVSRRDTPARHKTLRATIDWSHQLLTIEQRSLLARLGVFVGGFTTKSAEAVILDLDVAGPGGLEVLLDNGLISHRDSLDGVPRFGMLEPVRQYALARLGESGLLEENLRRHAAYFADFAEEAASGLWSRAQARWLELLDADQANLRAVLQRSQQPGAVEFGLRVAGSLSDYWGFRDLDLEVRTRLERALQESSTSPVVRAKALLTLSIAANRLDDPAGASDPLDECLTLVPQLRDARLAALFEVHKARTEFVLGNGGKAAVHCERADVYANEDGNPWTRLAVLKAQQVCTDDSAEGQRRGEAALRLAEALGDTMQTGWTHSTLAYDAIIVGDFELARDSLERAAAVAGGQSTRLKINVALHRGLLELLDGGADATTVRYLTWALRGAAKGGNTMSVREALDGLAAIAVRTGDLARACRLAATAEAVCDLRREPADDLIRERLLGSLPAAALAGRDVRSNERLTTAEIDATLVEIAAQASDIELFDRIERPGGRVERVTVTLLLTDIVDSTRRAVALGDAAWLQLSDAHVAASRRALDRHDGTEAKNTGDGLLASFDRPTDAIRCAQAINEATRQLGLDIRTGVHLGECDVLNDDVRGIAVHVVARVCALAGAGEVLVTQPVRDLIDGELGIECASRGRTELRGLPGGWELFEMR